MPSRGSAGGRELAGWVRGGLDAGGRDAEGKGDAAGGIARGKGAGDRGVALGDVDEDAWAEEVFLVGGLVRAEGDLVGGAGVEEFWGKG